MTTRSLHSLAAQAMAGEDPASGAILPPLQFSTTFLRDPDNEFRRGRVYGRPDNPGFDAPERLINAMEGGEECLLFSSGMAAATAVFLALRPGDHVVAPEVMYWALRSWLTTHAVEWGLQVDLVDMTDPRAARAAVRPGSTKLVWIETPANPTWAVTDISALAEVAHAAGAVLAVDSTAATPVLTRPLEHGADIVMHSATKYLNGHGDVFAGALVTAACSLLWERVRQVRMGGGAIAGTMEAWLLFRGLRTLPLRMERVSRSAMAIASALLSNPAVARVHYPGLPDDPGHVTARRQMACGYGGMLSIELAGGEEAAIETAARTRLWRRATSFGGLESLVEHRRSIEGPASVAAPGLLRLSVGMEDPDELLEDLNQAMEGADRGGDRPHGDPDPSPGPSTLGPSPRIAGPS